ncbi:hypothetical protein Tco_0804584 [Tanacetum coccineum]|uniref:Uncharacterized protein n=1 Tax=Tanacetum coccineum TaxID=301880 RepID=A0ABQ5A7A1_9ASTR
MRELLNSLVLQENPDAVTGVVVMESRVKRGTVSTFYENKKFVFDEKFHALDSTNKGEGSPTLGSSSAVIKRTYHRDEKEPYVEKFVVEE